ncbi:hypothetical protein [Paenibacillus sp. NPDC057967]|uniref:hypothetical protein n=1 Tax=Paenibacillus sp. NPDC057967 TaxID=3346293 RepID=UPI0036DE77EA
MTRKLTFVFVCLLMFAALIGCTNSGEKDKVVEDGIVVNMISTSLGGDNPDNTRVSYSFDVWNRLGKSVVVLSVKPVISKEILERLVERNITLEVNTPVKSNESQKISGAFQIDTKGMSKDEVIDLVGSITQFRIVTEQVVGQESGSSQ